MRPDQPISLFTSIRPPSPQDVSYLRQCLDSWRAAGFDVVAVNGPSEAETLRGLDLPVEYAVLPGDGKPRIGAILSAIRGRECRFAGIINSDCRIIKYPRLADNLKAGLERALLLAWRLDVSGDAEPVALPVGFDAFFFDMETVPHDDAGFSIGEPWWDFWFPVACELSGARIETLAVPMLTHKVHPANWNRNKWLVGGQRLWTALQSGGPPEASAGSLSAKVPAEWWRRDTLFPHELAKLAHIIMDWCRDCPLQTISVLGPEEAEIESIMRLGGRAMLEKVDAIDELASIRNSTSWRMTEPLRNAAVAARYFTSILNNRRRTRAGRIGGRRGSEG